jgi:RNA polymerase sigma-70 factor (ECF subfamily)
MNSNTNTFKDNFLEWHNTYSDAIFRFCSIKTSKRDVALDLTQESFTKLWEYVSNGNEVLEPKALLYRIATNLIIDYYRKKKSDSLDALTQNGFDVVDTVDLSPERRFEIQQLHTKINELPDKYKDILIMRFVDDLSVPEIAEVYNEHENTISVRIHRAVDKLRKIYTENE